MKGAQADFDLENAGEVAEVGHQEGHQVEERPAGETSQTQVRSRRLDASGRELRWWQDDDSTYHSTDSENYTGSPIFPESYYFPK